ESLLQRVEPHGQLSRRGLWKRKAQLESSPSCSIEQLGVVRGGNHNDIARKFINLHQQRAYYALDLTGFMFISTFLPQRVKLVEKQHTLPPPCLLKQLPPPDRGLAKEAAHDRVVSYAGQR